MGRKNGLRKETVFSGCGECSAHFENVLDAVLRRDRDTLDRADIDEAVEGEANDARFFVERSLAGVGVTRVAHDVFRAVGKRDDE